MAIILEKNISLTSSEEELFDCVCGQFFPWYYTGYSIQPDFITRHSPSKNIVFTHTCMQRATDELQIRGVENSNLLHPTEQFFMRICEENNIKVNNIYRAVYNCTFYLDELYDTFHKDHKFDHKLFIFYINEFDKGSTFIKNENNEIIEIKTNKNKAVVFDNCEHAQGFCDKYQRRIVLVITFD